ncbi:MAG: hypothetical protein LBN25_00250, partial [Christensenellaceae bacterium]|nr:hypothetical protein [Christensenellaceae bacterium]
MGHINITTTRAKVSNLRGKLRRITAFLLPIILIIGVAFTVSACSKKKGGDDGGATASYSVTFTVGGV